MSAFPPLLRSPPFPGVDPAIAAVSFASSAPLSAPIDRTALFSAIREARVGGAFWDARPVVEAGLTILRPRSSDDLAAMLALGHENPCVLLPRTGWSRRARRLTRAGAFAVAGDVDAWWMLDRTVRVIAHGDDEFAALAGIARVPVDLVSRGRFGRDGKIDEEAILDALLIDTTYRDPFTGAPSDIDAAIATLADWKAILDANRVIGAVAGIAWWKRNEMERFLWAPRTRRLTFTRSARRAVREAKAAGGGIAIWPSRVSPALIDGAARASVPLIRIEDGFVRSVGLGSALFPPFSIALDTQGIHYDPARPSDLETLLDSGAFPPALLARADALRRFILDAGISKYGGGPGGGHALPRRDPDRRLILVPGQVEDDMSVLLGGGDVAGNLDLLARVRAMEPAAEIWFRPHPDVDAGHRKGKVADADALRHADHIVRGGGMAALLDVVNGVHVLTSLTGFEALLRGCDVTTHGTPFYAGWGLTRDCAPASPRRIRRLSLAELVAGVLILYPRYLDPATKLPCPPEVLMAHLAAQAKPAATWLTRLRDLQGRLVKRLG